MYSYVCLGTGLKAESPEAIHGKRTNDALQAKGLVDLSQGEKLKNNLNVAAQITNIPSLGLQTDWVFGLQKHFGV